MNVGDPKKAIVLAVVAVGVVTIAVFRSIPSGSPAAAMQRTSTAQTNEDGAKAERPVETGPTVDSFSHPNLGAPKSALAAQKDGQTDRLRSGGAGSGNIPVVPRVDGVFGPPVRAESALDPGESAGNNQQKKEERAPVLVRLEMIVRSEQAFVMLVIGSDKSGPLTEGSFVGGDIRIVRIKEASVVLSTRGKETEVMLGQQVQL